MTLFIKSFCIGFGVGLGLFCALFALIMIGYAMKVFE